MDFAKNAESLGAAAVHVGNERELRAALDQAKANNRTTLIAINVSIDDKVPGFESWWDVPVAEISDEPAVQQARADYEERLKKQRVFVS